ncbi:hypothetical protein Tsubulata_020143, partial [Turnera subulata]
MRQSFSIMSNPSMAREKSNEIVDEKSEEIEFKLIPPATRLYEEGNSDDEEIVNYMVEGVSQLEFVNLKHATYTFCGDHDLFFYLTLGARDSSGKEHIYQAKVYCETLRHDDSNEQSTLGLSHWGFKEKPHMELWC